MASSWSIFRLLLLFIKTSLVINYPLTSEPLKNNPEHWGEGSWLIFDPKNASIPYPSPFISSKAKKITAKSIFITPNFSMQNALRECKTGYKTDDNGKCIKIVNINKDDIIASQLQHLFSGTVNIEENYDYGDYDEGDGNDSTKVQTNPTRFSLPINAPANVNNTNNKPMKEKHMYVIESLTITSQADIDTTTMSTDTKVSTIDYGKTQSFETKTENLIETTTNFEETTVSTIPTDQMDVQQTTLATLELKLKDSNKNTFLQSNQNPPQFVLKKQRIPKPTIKNKSTVSISKLDRQHLLKRTTKAPNQKTTVGSLTSPKPFFWLPKGWKIDNNSPSPMLIRFWSEMPLVQDNPVLTTSKPKNASKNQKLRRINSRRPQEAFVKEVYSQELKKLQNKEN